MQTLSKLTIEQKNELKKGVIEVTGKAMNRSALGVVDAIFTLYPNITFSELKEILPEFVNGTESENEYLGIDYNGILALAVKAIQELKGEIDILKAR